MGTQLIVNGVFLNGVCKRDLAFKKEEFDDSIASGREKLMMLAASSPRDLTDVEGNPVDWIDHCQFEVKQILDELLEDAVNRHLAVVALANPEDVVESY